MRAQVPTIVCRLALTLEWTPGWILSPGAMTPRSQLIASALGTILIAVCCFTPLLVIVLATVGLAVFTPYLDLVLFPALAVLIALTWISYRRYMRSTGQR